MSKLAHRLEDIPGVASVVVDLEDDGGGINVRLVPGADEAEVMDRLRTVLISYGVRPSRPLPVESLPKPRNLDVNQLGVEVKITPMKRGARVEVQSKVVHSFRLVAADRFSIAQGLADAWSQVVGRVPTPLAKVAMAEGVITVVAKRDGTESIGSATVDMGWQAALTLAVGRAIGTVTE